MRGKHWEDGWLTVEWKRPGRGESHDIVYSGVKSDTSLMHYFMTYLKDENRKPLIEELKERGYDIETLQFSIRRSGEKIRKAEEARRKAEAEYAERREQRERSEYERLKAKYEQSSDGPRNAG